MPQNFSCLMICSSWGEPLCNSDLGTGQTSGLASSVNLSTRSSSDTVAVTCTDTTAVSYRAHVCSQSKVSGSSLSLIESVQFNIQKYSWMSQFTSLMLYYVSDNHYSNTIDLPFEFVKFMIENIWRGDGTPSLTTSRKRLSDCIDLCSLSLVLTVIFCLLVDCDSGSARDGV